MKDSEIKQQLKKIMKSRQQQKILLILRNHPPNQEFKNITEVLEYCKDYI